MGSPSSAHSIQDPLIPDVHGSRSIVPCNFRSAGRISNELARSLTATHESFARYLTADLNSHLSDGIKVRLLSLDQLPIKDHIAAVPQLDYIVSFPVKAMASTVILECEIDLVFPIIDLLLGGTGAPVFDATELSELEEVVLQDLTAMIARQIETTWRMPAKSLSPGRRIKSSGLSQCCPPTDKVTVATLEMEVGTVTGAMKLVYPTSFVNVQSKQIKTDEPQKKGQVRQFPTASLRERILDCDFVVAADLPSMKVQVRDLIALQPGSVLKLRAPVRQPGMLTVGGREIFEAVPVRNGSLKAAQLGRRIQTAGWGKA
jgi:flagellar motor switch protein FliM